MKHGKTSEEWIILVQPLKTFTQFVSQETMKTDSEESRKQQTARASSEEYYKQSGKELHQDKQPTFRSANEEQDSFDKITAKGKENGLFQQCMKAIRLAHFQSNRFRAVLVVAGLFTDKRVYRDVIALFYVVTKGLEDKLTACVDNDKICQMIQKDLGYSFTKGYEQDLEALYGPTWKQDVEKALQGNTKAQEYLQRIQQMTTGEELAGAVFVLWGALIIGGGAAAKPKVQARFGKDAVHLFESVTGPGRETRKRQFVKVWDSLVDIKSSNDDDDNNDYDNYSKSLQRIVESTTACMQGNNDILCSLARNPWWYGYLQGSIVVGASILVYGIRQRYLIRSV